MKFLINNANFDLNTSNYINLNQVDDKGNDVFYYAKKYNNEKVMNIMSKI